jgi:DNA-directed RNA polymerase specialized sigma24 family protein
MADTTQENALPLNSVAAAAKVSADARRESEVIVLFDLLRPPLLRYLMSLGLADGEEIVQEVFLALFEHLGRGGSRENLRGWLFRVAHNLGLKRARGGPKMGIRRRDGTGSGFSAQSGAASRLL